MPIVWNPFAGKSVEEARGICREIFEDLCDGLPTRPTLPGEDAYEDGVRRVYTSRAGYIIECVEMDARRAAELAGLDPDEVVRTGVSFS